jgi:hypothetical protein
MPFKTPSSFSKSDLTKGLQTIGKLWNKGLLPKDLERHYFLHWFVVYNGNILQTANALQIHRNTIQGHFLDLGYSKKSVRLRHAWAELMDKNKSNSFESNFLSFYEQFGAKPQFTAEENKVLIALWKTKFNFKTLSSHYLLWALRSGKTKDWVQKKLDYSTRHRIRLLTGLLKPKNRDGFWLSVLKPSSQEIYSPRYRNILSKTKKG